MGIEQLQNARIEGNKLFFTSELVLSNSFMSHNLGSFENVMQFYLSRKDAYNGDVGYIEWEYSKGGESDSEVIGLWFDNQQKLVDYDGVFELPREAVVLLEHLGYNCDYVKDE